MQTMLEKSRQIGVRGEFGAAKCGSPRAKINKIRGKIVKLKS